MKLRDKLALCYRILKEKPGYTYAHAERELPEPEGGEMQELMNSQLKELVLVFTTHGHSGFSAQWAVACLTKLLKHEPLGPLTGEPSEWGEVSEGLFQNKRCSHVFKENGVAYDIQGRIFKEANGSCYTSFESRVTVTFPYTPTSEYVLVE